MANRTGPATIPGTKGKAGEINFFFSCCRSGTAVGEVLSRSACATEQRRLTALPEDVTSSLGRNITTKRLLVKHLTSFVQQHLEYLDVFRRLLSYLMKCNFFLFFKFH